MSKIILLGIFIFIGLFSMQESFSQYMETPSSDKWYEAVKLVLQEYVDKNLLQNEAILKDSIKTRISGGLEDVLPPRYHVRIIYDVINNEEIQHMDSIYKVDFGPWARTPENAKLVKLFEMEYKPPKKIVDSLGIEENVYVYNNIQNIMCRQGFEKVIKESTDEDVCLTPNSIGKLVDRGWIKIDYTSLRILQKENYDSLRVPIIVTHEQPDPLLPDYSYISTKIWNLRNITMNYSVEVFDPIGEKVKDCPFTGVQSPQKQHSIIDLKLFLNSCDHKGVFGDYTVIVSSDSLNETFIVNVSK